MTRRRNLTIAAAVSIALIVGSIASIGGVAYAQDSEAQAVSLSQAEAALHVAASDLGERRVAWNDKKAAIKAAIASAEGLLTSSEGHVLDETSRTALDAAVADAKAKLSQADARLDMVNRDYDQMWSGIENTAAAVTAVAERIKTVELPKLDIDISTEVAAVEADVTAWETEQARIEAERIAAEKEAAEKAAREAAAAKPATPSRPGETQEQRIQRLMNALGISMSFEIRNSTGACGASDVLGCYETAGGATIVITPYGLTKSDSMLCRTISHEYRHYIQVRDMLGLNSATGQWDTNWMEADARAHERGC